MADHERVDYSQCAGGGVQGSRCWVILLPDQNVAPPTELRGGVPCRPSAVRVGAAAAQFCDRSRWRCYGEGRSDTAIGRVEDNTSRELPVRRRRAARSGVNHQAKIVDATWIPTRAPWIIEWRLGIHVQIDRVHVCR